MSRRTSRSSLPNAESRTESRTRQRAPDRARTGRPLSRAPLAPSPVASSEERDGPIHVRHLRSPFCALAVRHYVSRILFLLRAPPRKSAQSASQNSVPAPRRQVTRIEGCCVSASRASPIWRAPLCPLCVRYAIQRIERQLDQYERRRTGFEPQASLLESAGGIDSERDRRCAATARSASGDSS